MNNFNNQKGIAILLALLVLSGILVIALGVVGLKINRMKLSRNISDSAVAYYAAESGIEEALFEDRNGGWDPAFIEIDTVVFSGNLDNGTSYEVILLSNVGPVRIKSIGSFGAVGKKTKRSVEISY